MWLKLVNQGPNGVRLTWGNSIGPYGHYDIGTAGFESVCLAVRDAMAELVRVSNSREAPIRARALKNLARAGANLFYVMFDPLNKEEKPKARNARAALAENHAAGDHKMYVTGDPWTHVPWSLVYDGDPDEIPADAGRFEDFPGFWGLKYALSSSLTGYLQPGATLRRKSSNARLLSLINDDEASAAQEALSEDLRAAYRAFLERPVGAAHNLRACKKLALEAARYDTIMHVFAHHSGGELDLGEDERISIVEFRKLLECLTERHGETASYSLVIVNACVSAAGRLDYSFVSATDCEGICGLIGTEAVVPRDFAARFAVRLLTMILVEGKSIGEAIWELHHEPTLWPLSLLYGCYAHPDYRISN